MVEYLHALVLKADAGDGVFFAGDVIAVTVNDPNVWGRLDVSDYAVGAASDPGDVLRAQLETVDPGSGIAQEVLDLPFAEWSTGPDGEKTLVRACDPAKRVEVE